MSPGRWLSLAGVAMLAAVAGVWWAARSPDAPPPASPPSPAEEPRPEHVVPRPAEPEETPPDPHALGSVPVPPEKHSRLLPADAEAEGGDRSRLPSKIDYPVYEKLTGEPLSEIPHEVVGAWDETAGAPGLGERRVFILVVEPTLSDADLENLVRDVLDRHRDAQFLTLRVFDSPIAATTPSHLDGGAFPYSHLVAELRSHPLRDEPLMRIRGRAIER